MYHVSTINKINTEASLKAKAETAPSSSYAARADGTYLVAWHPPGQRRVSKTLSFEQSAKFVIDVETARTKTGKIPQRAVDKLVYDLIAPAPVYEVTTLLDGRQYGLTKRRDHDILGRKTLGPRKSKQFAAELAGITINPDRAPKKHKEAVSRLAATYFGD